MSTPAADELQKVFKTLADPTRVRILRLLEQEELIVGELMAVLGMAQSRVSRHLAILREAGLVEAEVLPSSPPVAEEDNDPFPTGL